MEKNNFSFRTMSWAPFVILVISEKNLAKASKLFRIASKDSATAPLETAGTYVCYRHDRTDGLGVGQRLLRKVVTSTSTSIGFRGFGRDESNAFEGGSTFNASSAELINQITYNWEEGINIETLFNETIVKQLYPSISPSKTKWNAAFESALLHFVGQKKLFSSPAGFVTLDGEVLTADTVEKWLMEECSGSLLTRVLGLGQRKIESAKAGKKETSKPESVLPPVLSAEDWT